MLYLVELRGWALGEGLFLSTARQHPAGRGQKPCQKQS